MDKKARMLTEHDNNCSLIALHQVCDRSEEEIFKVALRNGYNPRCGMTVTGLEKSFKDLGVMCDEVYEADFENDLAITVNQARSRWKSDVMILCSMKHVFVSAHGIIIDPNESNYGLKRRVYYAYKVLNHGIPEYTRDLNHDTRLRFRVDPGKAAHRSSQNSRSLLAMKFLEFINGGAFTVHDAMAQGLCRLSYIRKLVDTGVLLKVI